MNGLLQRLRGVASAIAGVMILGGCATFAPDGGFGTVEQAVEGRIGKEAVVGANRR